MFHVRVCKAYTGINRGKSRINMTAQLFTNEDLQLSILPPTRSGLSSLYSYIYTVQVTAVKLATWGRLHGGLLSNAQLLARQTDS